MSFSPRSRNFNERHLDNDRGTSLRMFSRHSRISKFSSRPSSWGRSIREMPLSWRVFRVTRKGVFDASNYGQKWSGHDSNLIIISKNPLCP